MTAREVEVLVLLARAGVHPPNRPPIEYAPIGATGIAHAAQRAALVTGTVYTGPLARSSRPTAGQRRCPQHGDAFGVAVRG